MPHNKFYPYFFQRKYKDKNVITAKGIIHKLLNIDKELFYLFTFPILVVRRLQFIITFKIVLGILAFEVFYAYSVFLDLGTL